MQNRFVTNFGKSLQQLGAHSKTFMEDLEMTFEYILNKLFKRNNLEFSIHSASSNHPIIKSHIKDLSDSLKNKYKRRDF